MREKKEKLSDKVIKMLKKKSNAANQYKACELFLTETLPNLKEYQSFFNRCIPVLEGYDAPSRIQILFNGSEGDYKYNRITTKSLGESLPKLNLGKIICSFRHIPEGKAGKFQAQSPYIILTVDVADLYLALRNEAKLPVTDNDNDNNNQTKAGFGATA